MKVTKGLFFSSASLFTPLTLVLASGILGYGQQSVAVAVTPSTASVLAGKTIQVRATVTGTSNTAVKWIVLPRIGTVSSTGLYSAPAAVNIPTAVTVTATSVANASKNASSVVTIKPVVGVSVAPATASVNTGQTAQFTSSITGTNQTGVNWSISPALGFISTAGLYSAPAIVSGPTNVTITATSKLDPTQKASAIATVKPLVGISVATPASTVSAGKTIQLTSTVTGNTNAAVTWSVSPVIGSVSAGGGYTAPAQVPVTQQVTLTATSVADPTKKASVPLVVNPASLVSFTSGNNGLTSLMYNGTEFNYQYSEGLLSSVKYQNGASTAFVYAPPCSRSNTTLTITQQCVAGPVQVAVTATHTLAASDTIYVDLTVTNNSTVVITEASFSVLGLQFPQFDLANSRILKLDSTNPLGVVNFTNGRFFLWLETPGADATSSMWCGNTTTCKHQPAILNIAPGQTKSIRVAGRFTPDLTSYYQTITPEAYLRFSAAYPAIINWPDRRPIMAWWIADGTKRSAINPRGYLQQPLLDVSNTANFSQQVYNQAVKIRDMMNARPVRPQGLIVWDLEGQEFILPTTYVGDPTAFAKGYAAEMNAAADQMFQVFKSAGYKVGVTIRSQSMQFGTQLPSTCTYSPNHDFKSYYIKVDNPFGARFHACYDPAGVQWLVVPNGNGGQTALKAGSVAAMTALLKAKIDYARQRWGTTLYYMDSAVWAGGTPLDASIIQDLQRTYPDSLFIPEQESLGTIGAAIPFAEPAIPAEPRYSPISWRWVYPTGAFAIALQNCVGNCWTDNLDKFAIGQRVGDIAIYAQPTQLGTQQLQDIESMITQARTDASVITVTDSKTGVIRRWSGDVTSVLPYPVKMRVYFAPSSAQLASSALFCEAGQFLGETACNLDLTGIAMSQVRYYDFTNRLVRTNTATVLP